MKVGISKTVKNVNDKYRIAHRAGFKGQRLPRGFDKQKSESTDIIDTFASPESQEVS
jgi:hypothetical protein